MGVSSCLALFCNLYSRKSIKAALWELTLRAQINYLAALLMNSVVMRCAGKCTTQRALGRGVWWWAQSPSSQAVSSCTAVAVPSTWAAAATSLCLSPLHPIHLLRSCGNQLSQPGSISLLAGPAVLWLGGQAEAAPTTPWVAARGVWEHEGFLQAPVLSSGKSWEPGTSHQELHMSHLLPFPAQVSVAGT